MILTENTDSVSGLNQLEQSRVRIPLVQSNEIDQNRDGIFDQLHFVAKFPLANQESVVSVSIFLVFDYSLSLYSRFQMESLIYAEEQARIPASKLEVKGDLALFQRMPLWYRGIDHRFDQAVINGTSLRADDFAIPNILSKYFARNVTTKLDPKFSIWKPSPVGIEEFTVEVTVSYSTETVLYYAGFWELIKWGWVQYLSVLIVFIFVFGRIREFVFGNRLLLSVPEKLRYHG